MLKRLGIVCAVLGVSLFAACSGNLSNGATPPVTPPQPLTSGVMPQSNGMTVNTGSTPIPSPTPYTVVIKKGATPLPLPDTGNITGSICLTVVSSEDCNNVAASASPPASPSSSPSAEPSATPTVTPASVHVQMLVQTSPSPAPTRSDSAASDDAATQLLIAITLQPQQSGSTLPGLSAVMLRLPPYQIANQHRYALALFDYSRRTSAQGLIHHRESAAGNEMVYDANPHVGHNGVLSFASGSAIPLSAKGRYVLVLYTDFIEVPTPGPSITNMSDSPALASSTPSASGIATAYPYATAIPGQANTLQAPISGQNFFSTPLPAATFEVSPRP